MYHRENVGAYFLELEQRTNVKFFVKLDKGGSEITHTESW